MSHFTVITVHKDGEDPEELLTPYQENNMGNCPKKYLEYIGKYTLEEAEKERLETINKYKECLKKKTYKKRSGLSDYEKKTNPKEIYGTKENFEYYIKLYQKMDVEQYMDDYHGMELSKEHNSFGCWENPNAKWDWYSMGGRWTGYFKVKEGKLGILGDRGMFDTAPRQGYADQVMVKDIDFEGMRKDNLKRVKDLWKEYQKKLEKEGRVAHIAYDVKEGMTRKDFIEERMRGDGWMPFAFIGKDGEWYERGSMGWWGCVSNEDTKKHENTFEDFIKNLEDDDILTVWDCHI